MFDRGGQKAIADEIKACMPRKDRWPRKYLWDTRRHTRCENNAAERASRAPVVLNRVRGASGARTTPQNPRRELRF
eukprot:12886726-Alexandrium_andersonii.AAC.1